MKSHEEKGNMYGERLLKQMGWSEGKGLGKHEDGIKEFVKVKKKMNTKGIGFNGVDDKWIEHQEAFDDLLANLNGGRPPEDQQQQLSAIEERSRRLGGRVHYSKFLRGKDLSQKKQKDLDAIIIKRKRDKVADDTEEHGKEAATVGYPNTHTSNMSYQEYFAGRMKNLKAAQGKETKIRGSPEHKSGSEDVPVVKKSRSKSRKQHPENTFDESTAETDVAEREQQKRKKATSDEHYDEASDREEPASLAETVMENGGDDGEGGELRLSDNRSQENREHTEDSHPPAKKKKKKRSGRGERNSAKAEETTAQGAIHDNEGTLSPLCADVPRGVTVATKRSKSRHRKEESVLESNNSESRNGAVANSQEVEQGNGICDEPNKQKRTKRKHNKTDSQVGEKEGESEVVEQSQVEEDVRRPKSKKRKKKAGKDGSSNGHQSNEETEETPAERLNGTDTGETMGPKKGGTKTVEKTPFRLLKHKNKACPIVKKGKAPRISLDQAGRLAQSIVESPEASRAVNRQSGGNRSLMASRLSKLLLRELRGSNWAHIPGYGSSVWMEKCTALLALTLREQEEKAQEQETTD